VVALGTQLTVKFLPIKMQSYHDPVTQAQNQPFFGFIIFKVHHDVSCESIIWLSLGFPSWFIERGELNIIPEKMLGD
jgi:hypothetical protein